MLIRRMPFLLHPSDTGGTGDGAGTGTTTQSSDTGTGAGDGATTETPADTGAGDGAGTPKTYTEDEVQALLNRRLKGQGKELTSAQKRLKDLEAAEAERQRAAMTEQERIQAERDEAKREAEEARAERDRILEERAAERAAHSAAEALTTYKPVSQRVADLLPSEAREVGDDGKLTDAAKAAIKQFAIDNPTLFADTGAGTTTGAASGDVTTTSTTAGGDGFYARIARRNAGGQR